MRRHGLILLIVFTLISVAAAWAHRSGPDIVRECPECGILLQQATMMSGNTAGARIWTDGKMDAPMLPDRPWLVKCPQCDTLFWIDEARKVGEQNRNLEDRSWPGAIDPDLPSEADFLNVLSDSGLSEDKELYLRRRAWWAANDLIRADESAIDSLISIQLEPVRKANLEALANRLDENKPEERIIKAEIYRELKRFDKCITLLSEPFEDEYHAEFAAFIRELAEQKSWRVREITAGE